MIGFSAALTGREILLHTIFKMKFPWLPLCLGFRGGGPPPADPIKHSREIAIFLLWQLGALKEIWNATALGDDFNSNQDIIDT
jgi:hypothetical protein